ncbi:hypothetical protein MTBBW1_2410010 [Desulfamplus magnetovallimortis]|uniref:Uncharacterized protein n=1 Tax=Desulfamplus magnetovallimortis TaxID=1246637 RepID=A0A1W1HEI9_9BACT|nr:hypothetical protein [Desulfamplus magnetovallimortis]SLM30792.1 hypothetical protein MTBBW1_2410010 [Desulfamplus magnetovallimortis]
MDYCLIHYRKSDRVEKISFVPSKEVKINGSDLIFYQLAFNSKKTDEFLKIERNTPIFQSVLKEFGEFGNIKDLYYLEDRMVMHIENHDYPK